MPSWKPKTEIGKSVESDLRYDLCLKSTISFILGRNNSLPELVDFLGYEKAMQLVLLFGGQQLKIPKPAELVRPLNVAGAALAVIEGKLEPAQAAQHFCVELKAVNRCVEIVRQEQARMRRNTDAIAGIVKEIEEQRLGESESVVDS